MFDTDTVCYNALTFAASWRKIIHQFKESERKEKKYILKSLRNVYLTKFLSCISNDEKFRKLSSLFSNQIFPIIELKYSTILFVYQNLLLLIILYFYILFFLYSPDYICDRLKIWSHPFTSNTAKFLSRQVDHYFGLKLLRLCLEKRIEASLEGMS